MMLSDSSLKCMLVGVLVLGGLGAAGPSATYSEFSDAHNGTANVTAATFFNGPTADAGGPYEADISDYFPLIQLDGTGSTADQGQIDEYSWRIVEGPGTIIGRNSAEPLYNPPDTVEGETNVTVELNVTDNRGRYDINRTTIVVYESGDGGFGWPFGATTSSSESPTASETEASTPVETTSAVETPTETATATNTSTPSETATPVSNDTSATATTTETTVDGEDSATQTPTPTESQSATATEAPTSNETASSEPTATPTETETATNTETSSTATPSPTPE